MSAERHVNDYLDGDGFTYCQECWDAGAGYVDAADCRYRNAILPGTPAPLPAEAGEVEALADGCIAEHSPNRSECVNSPQTPPGGHAPDSSRAESGSEREVLPVPPGGPHLAALVEGLADLANEWGGQAIPGQWSTAIHPREAAEAIRAIITQFPAVHAAALAEAERAGAEKGWDACVGEAVSVCWMSQMTRFAISDANPYRKGGEQRG